MKKLLLPILLTFILSGHLLAVAGPSDPVLEAAREAAAEGSTAAFVAQVAKFTALVEGLSGPEASREAARASSRAVAEKEFETSGDATLAGTKARDAAIAAGVDVEEAVDIASEKAAQAVADKALADGQTSTQVAEKAREATTGAGLDAESAKEKAAGIAAEKVAEKAIAEGKTATEVAEETKRAAEGAGLDAEAAKERAAEVATEKITEKAIADGKSASQVAAEARSAAEGAGLDAEAAKEKAADIATEKITEKALADGESIEAAAGKARAAAEGAGLDAEAAKDRAGRIAAEKVAEKAIAEGKTATEVAEETKRAAEGAGLDAESAKERAAEVATEKITEKAIADGKSATEVAAEARSAAEGAGLDQEAAKEKAAQVAAEKITEKALADGESVEAAAGKARAAAEGAGLDAEAAKDRAADVAAEKVAEKALADGKTAAEAGAEALAAAKAAGVSDEVAKEKAGSRAADIAAREAMEKGFSEEEAKDRAKEAAEAAGISATEADDIARSAASDAVGNRTPDVSNVIAAQLVGTKLLRINYDLSVSDGRPCTVTIRWSTDNGDNFDLTATAVTGDVGPGVAPGKNLEATWDMGVDWDNKYTEDGRIEVIASRISDEGAPDDLVVIPAEGASWDLANEKKELVVTLPAEVLSPQEVDWIKEARDHERLAWVDVRFPVGDNGEKGFFWGSEDVFIGQPGGKVILRFPHTTALDAPGVNLLDIETFAYNGDTLRLSDLPPKGTPSLSLEFSIDVPDDWQEEGEPGPALGKDYVGGSGLEMIWVEPGTFTMGSPASEPDRGTDETQHEVTLTQGYWLGRYEVTQALYEEVMGVNPSHFKGPQLPVETVSWDDAIAFIQKLNQRELDAGLLPEGIGYSLPTEAQWEYACRAGTTTAYSFGAANNLFLANSKDSNLGKTTDVGSYPANAWGFHDLHGNVWEWTADWHGNYPAGTVSDPAGAETGSKLVIHGGSFYDLGRYMRSAYRAGRSPDRRIYTLGFRLSLQQIQ